MITAARHFGGTKKLDLAVDEVHRIHPAVAKLWIVNGDTGSRVTLPSVISDLEGFALGGPLLLIANIGADTLQVEDPLLAFVSLVSVGDMLFVWLASKDSSPSWVYKTKALV